MLNNIRYLYSDLVLFSTIFSIIFCFFCSLVDNLMSFWVFLELCGLSIVPCFFYASDSSIYGFYSSLLTYIIISGVSSALLMGGLLFVELYYFILFGFLIKFGMFPFSLWVYRVFSSSNWVFIFFLSVILKFPILFFCFLLQFSSIYVIILDSSFTIFMCSVFFWIFSLNWSFIWCHMSLSSVSTLFIACFYAETNLCFFIYFYYFIWALFCVIYFYFLSDSESLFSKFWVYCFLFLVTPMSLPLFYKLSVSFAVFYSSFYVILVWSIYSFSEQIFLFKVGGDYFYSGIYNLWV